MKKRNRIISLILALSLLVSTVAITVNAAESRSGEITDTEFFEPTATFTKATQSSQLSGIVRADYDQNLLSANATAQYLFSSPDLLSYVVQGTEADNENQYIMLVPSDEAARDGKVKNHAYYGTQYSKNQTLTYGANQYYVFEANIATESEMLLLDFQINARYMPNNSNPGSTSHTPGNMFTSFDAVEIYDITPGVFHQLTIIGHPDTNTVYVYLDDSLIRTINDGVIKSDSYSKFTDNVTTDSFILTGMRIQTHAGTIKANQSVCLDNISERVLVGDNDASTPDVANYAGRSSIRDWSQSNTYNSAYRKSLPSVVNINGVKYSDVQSASSVLNTYKLGTKIEILRSCYGGSLTVNCDAKISLPMNFDAKLTAGKDVTLTQIDANTWISTLKNHKHSAITSAYSDDIHNLTSALRYNASDNLIKTVSMTSAVNARTYTEEEYNALPEAQKQYVTVTTSGGVTTYVLKAETISANGFNSAVYQDLSISTSITTTDNGNEYLIIRDKTDQTGDFPLNVHFQVNASTGLNINNNTGEYINPESFMLKNHDYVVFEQDIYSESEFVNIYNAFNLRTGNNKPLSVMVVFADAIGTSFVGWHHVTYVGDVATGDSYVFVDGECIFKVVDGLYDNASIGKMAVYLKMAGDPAMQESYSYEELIAFTSQLTEAQKQECIDNMILGYFRTMQVAGENKSGKDLSPNASAATDNFYLRWLDNDSELEALISAINADYEENGSLTNTHSIEGLTNNIYNENYIENILPEEAVLATVNGVDYFDTHSINALLNDTDYTTSLKEIVLYREYIGTIYVNCRASIKLNGITSAIQYSEDVTVNASSDIIQVYKQNKANGNNKLLAAVDGVLYYASNGATNNERALRDLLQGENASELTVTFLSAPSQAITINSNAVVDLNGLNITNVTFGDANCVRIDNESTVTVINLKTTYLIATLNGVDFRKGEEDQLQAAVNAADSVSISFYTVPTTPIKIAHEATIDVNGLVTGGVTSDQLFTTDDVSFVIEGASDASYDYTITEYKRTSAVEVRVMSGSTLIHSVRMTAKFGTDIVELLQDNGLYNGFILTKDSSGNSVINFITWEATPSGIVSSENTYVYTAAVTDTYTLTSDIEAVFVNGNAPSKSDVSILTAAQIPAKLKESGNGSVIFNSNITVNETVTLFASSGGSKNVYLNGYTFENAYTAEHALNGSGASHINFYGDGTIKYTAHTGSKALLFLTYSFTGKITFNNLTIKTSSELATIRSGSVELNGCNVDAYVVGSSRLFALAEQYNGYSSNPISLTLIDCNIDYRYPDPQESYASFSKNNPMIYSKVVTHRDENKIDYEPVPDPAKTVIIDGCTIKSQGSLVAANGSKSNAADAYLKSNLKLYLNNSEIIAKELISGNIRANSVYICDDVRTNIDNDYGLTFATDVIKAKTSDGIYKVLYTSHDFANITWSNGLKESWATGSVPTNFDCRFDHLTSTPNLGYGQTDTEYDSTGSSFHFGLFANLTLSDVIGFNVYVPVTLRNGQSVDHNDVIIYLDGKRVYANTYADSDEVRTTIVKAAEAYGEGYCYDYTITFAPQEAAKSFTIVIIYDGKCVSRTISVADYAESLLKGDINEKNKSVLAATLAYIEKATMYAGNTVDMSRITALRNHEKLKSVNVNVTPTEPTEPSVTHTETLADFSKYIQSVQIRIKDNSAFKFKLQNGVNAGDFKFYVANDTNTGYVEKDFKIVTIGGSTYLELSLRAYEMARTIKIVYGDEYCTYSLYKLYNATETLANASTVTGETHEYKAMLKYVEALYSYASICDKYLNTNASEYTPEA